MHLFSTRDDSAEKVTSVSYAGNRLVKALVGLNCIK